MCFDGLSLSRVQSCATASWPAFTGMWVVTIVIAVVYSIKAGRGQWAEYPGLGALVRRVLKIGPGGVPIPRFGYCFRPAAFCCWVVLQRTAMAARVCPGGPTNRHASNSRLLPFLAKTGGVSQRLLPVLRWAAASYRRSHLRCGPHFLDPDFARWFLETLGLQRM